MSASGKSSNRHWEERSQYLRDSARRAGPTRPAPAPPIPTTKPPRKSWLDRLLDLVLG